VSSLKSKFFIFFDKAKKAFEDFLLVKIKRIFFKSYEEKKLENQKNFDKKLVYTFSKTRMPSIKQLKYVGRFLSSKELWALRISILIFIISFGFVSFRFYVSHRQIVPAVGGQYTEGLRGAPKYINPLYSSLNDADSDIGNLIFSSLFKRDKNGKLEKDLVKNYQISEDNKVYTVTLKNNIKWHDGADLTADDVVFTFGMIKDERYKSPLKKIFSGVEIEKVDNAAVKFILAEPYAPFLELLTFGILPENLWSRVSPSAASLAELNLKPIGSGPYKFKSLKKDDTGSIKIYSLTANGDYYGEKPKISGINFKFFPNFEEEVRALSQGDIDGISYLPGNFEKSLVAKDSLNINRLNLSQLSAVFFNKKNNSGLSQKEVRQALSYAINKEKVVTAALNNNARIIDGPILPDNFAYNQNIKKYDYNKNEAERLLESAGWKIMEVKADDLSKAREAAEKSNNDKQILEDLIYVGEGNWRRKDNKFLTIKLTAVETEESVKETEMIKKFWEEIGVKTEINLIGAADKEFNKSETEIIRSRNYEALLYNQIVGADPDLYVLWHSSQAVENGLNLSNFENKEADQLLEEARIISDQETRKNKYFRFQEIIAEEEPAIFLYSPTYAYVQNKKIKGFATSGIIMPSDRFSSVSGWYIETKKKLVW